MFGVLVTMLGAFRQHWVYNTRAYGPRWLQRLPIAFVLGWLAARSGDPAVSVYLTVGVFLYIVWDECVFSMGWVLSDEFTEGTVEIDVVSPTPLMGVMLGKALAIAASAARGGLLGSGVVLLMSGASIQVQRPALLVLSTLVAVLALVATSFVFTPLFVLLRGRAGFFQALRPFGGVFGGFLFPISRLPAALQPIAWFLPTSWAMNGMILSIQAEAPWESVATHWLLALALSAVCLGITYLLFRTVEARVRLTGALSTF